MPATAWNPPSPKRADWGTTIVIPDWLFGELATETTYTESDSEGAVPRLRKQTGWLVRSVDDETNRRVISGCQNEAGGPAAFSGVDLIAA